MLSKKYIFIIICLMWITGCTLQDKSVVNENSIVDSQISSDFNEQEQKVIDDSNKGEIKYDENEPNPVIYGTWKLEKIVLISEEYDTIVPDGREWYGKEEEFLGKELEFSKEYLRLGDESFLNPNYSSKYITFDEYKSNGKFRNPHPYEVIEDEKIDIINRENYKDLADVELLTYSIDFSEDYPLPFGTYIVVLNEDTMFVGGWGKVALAYRVD